MKAVTGASPEVVINQLTALPKVFNPKDPDFYVKNNEIRTVGGHNLVEAAKAAGVRRFITQSLSFMYRQEGTWVKTEDDPVEDDAPGTAGDSFRAMIGHEREVLDAEEFEGLSLRYGFLYGADTWYAADGTTGLDVKKRKFPVVGAGTGTFSFIHPEDAAAAAVCAVENGSGGIYNSSTTNPPRSRTGSRFTRKRSAPSPRGMCRSGWQNWSRESPWPRARSDARGEQRPG